MRPPMTRAEFYAFCDEAMARPQQEPTDEPDPHRCDHLEPGTAEWARVGNAGHRCRRCGNGCGTSMACHEACCGTESYWRLRKLIGSYCTGHPCAACRGDGERPDAGVDVQPALFDMAGAP